MELTPEVIETLSLSEDVVKAINTFGTEAEAAIKQTYDGKANENAEKIIQGAIDSISKTTGIARDKEEKIADYFVRSNTAYSASKLAAEKDKLDTALLEVEKEKDKINAQLKDFKGNEVLSQEFTELKAKYDGLQQQEAEFKKLNESGIVKDHEELQANYFKLNVGLAFNEVRPTFPETVSPYEIQIKWPLAQARILEEYDIVRVGDVPHGKSKSNEHLTYPLADLIAKDVDVKGMLDQAREQTAPGAKTRKMTSVEGLPFEVPVDAKPGDINALIKEHLINTEKLSFTSDSFAKRFQELLEVAHKKAA